MLAELQKLDGLPVIRGDQEEEEASQSLPLPSDNNRKIVATFLFVKQNSSHNLQWNISGGRGR